MADQVEIETQVEYLIDEKKYKNALEKADKGLNNFPDSYSLRFSKGKALLGLGQAKEALIEFEKCAAESVSLVYPHFYMSQCFSILENKPEMLKSLRLAISADKKIAAEASKNPNFAKFKNDLQFNDALGLPAELPLDPLLKKVFEMRTNDPDAAFAKAKACLDKIQDQASTFDALLDILEVVIEDIEEHGEGTFMSADLAYEQALKYRDEYSARRKKLNVSKSAYRVFLEREGKV